MYIKTLIVSLFLCALGNTSFGQTPAAAFTSASNSGCAPLIVQFTDNSTESATWWHWDFGNGAISSQQNPGAIYTEPGTYTVSLIAGNASGSDSIVKTAYIQVYGKPDVNFGALLTNGCLPVNVQFTDSSKAVSGNITSYIWDFGDGQISAQTNPSHIYNNSGSYDISLTVQNSYGCKQSLQKKSLVQVAGKVTASYTYSYVNACQPPTRVQFNNTSTATGTLQYLWQFGDGTTATDASPEHTFNTAGDYNVQLVVISETGCSDTLQQKITIGSVKPAFTANANACTGRELSFTNTSSPAPVTTTWSFGDQGTATGTNAVHTFTTPGSYPVTMYANFGSCTDSSTQIISVTNKPVTAFSTPGVTNACEVPTTVAFNNATTGAASYIWNFGDGGTSSLTSPSHTYSQAGYYTVSLISFNAGGCSDTLIKENLLHVGPPRIKSLRNLPYSGCTPATLSMSAVMEDSAKVTSWLWNFGDGSTSEQATPAHMYTKAGTYNVSVAIRTSSGCTDTFTLQSAVTLASAPKTAFTASPLAVCGSKPIAFIDQTTGDTDSWLWNFGDGNFSSQSSPQHPYKDTGSFTITLITGYKQCYDTLVVKNMVSVKTPIARFTAAMKCEKPYDRTFTDNSIGATSWLWSFGDGQSSTQQNPSHTYSDTGTYTVQLITWNDACSDTMRKTINVIDEHPMFTHSPGEEFCRKQALLVEANNYIPSHVTAFIWSFGDSSSTSVQLNKVSHLYSNTGTYTVSLTTVDLNGCYAKSETQVYVEVFGNKANFTNPAGVCLDNDGNVTFTDKSTADSKHPIVEWKWNYGDGDSAVYNAAPFSHTYKKAGNYNVKMIIKDSYGCLDTITKNNTVIIADPVAAFTLKDSLGCSGANISFTNMSSALSPSYSWTFGDGTTSTQITPSHTYAAEGIYSVRLKVTDRFGCTDSTFKQGLVNIANPVAAFSLVDTFANCPPLIAAPVHSAQHTTAFFWNFDDGTTSTLEAPTHAYTQGGVFNLTLVVQGHGNCFDTAVHTVTVKGPAGKYTFTPAIACAPAAIAFKATVKNTKSLAWDFSDGTVVNGEDEIVSHTYSTHGAYVPKLVLIDENNCKVSITNKDTLFVRDVKALMNTTLQSGCDSALVAFTDSSQVWYDQISSYQWSFGDNTNGTGANTSHYYYNDGKYNAKLVVKTAMGCADSITAPLNIPVYQSPHPAIKAVDSVCYNSSMYFAGNDNRSNSAITSWVWDLGNGVSAPGQSNPYTYPYAGKYNVVLKATNAHGCTGSAAHTVTVLSLPQLDAGPDTSICLGQSLTMQPSGADNYTWTASSTLSCTQCGAAVANPAAGTRYYLKGSSNFGCVSYDSLFVDVKQPARLVRMGADTLCAGKSVQLHTSGAETYQWIPAEGLSSASIANPVASPAATTTYTVVGRDTKNCFSDTQTVNIKVYPMPQFRVIDSVHNVNVGYADTLQTSNSADITSWRWTPAAGLSCATCPNPVVMSKQDITYVAHAYNDGGCTAQDEVTVHVLCNGVNIFMPNTFSPNGDGMNDQFYPRGKGLFNIRALRIFSRWGQAVFEKLNFVANTASYGWDGNYAGQPAQAGVYVYIMEIECDNGTVMTYKGNVALLR